MARLLVPESTRRGCVIDGTDMVVRHLISKSQFRKREDDPEEKYHHP